MVTAAANVQVPALGPVFVGRASRLPEPAPEERSFAPGAELVVRGVDDDAAGLRVRVEQVEDRSPRHVVKMLAEEETEDLQPVLPAGEFLAEAGVGQVGE